MAKKTPLPQHALREESGLPYFDTLLALYRTRPDAVNGADAKQIVDELINKYTTRRSELTGADAFMLEAALLQLMPIEHVQQRRVQLRDTYRELAGDHLFDLYEKALPSYGKPPAYVETHQEVRADARFLLSEFQRLRLGYGQFERLRHKVKIHVVVLLCILAVLVVLMGLNQKSVTIAPVLWAVAASALGAMFSYLQRVGDAQPSGEVASQLNIIEAIKRRLLWGPYLSTLEGVIAGAVLHFIFIANLLGGDLFPRYEIDRAAKGFDALLWAGPVDGLPALAKVLVWSFIAGFAERFVPDVLGQIKQAGTAAARRPQERPRDTKIEPPETDRGDGNGEEKAAEDGGAGEPESQGRAEQPKEELDPNVEKGADDIPKPEADSTSAAGLNASVPIVLKRGGIWAITLPSQPGVPADATPIWVLSVTPPDVGVSAAGSPQTDGMYKVELAASADAVLGDTSEVVVSMPAAAGGTERIWAGRVTVVAE